MEKNPGYIYYGAKVQIISLLEGNKLTVRLPLRKYCWMYVFFSCPRTVVRINLARTKQPVKPVLPVKATAVCVLLDLTGSIARTVRKLEQTMDNLDLPEFFHASCKYDHGISHKIIFDI